MKRSHNKRSQNVDELFFRIKIFLKLKARVSQGYKMNFVPFRQLLWLNLRTFVQNEWLTRVMNQPFKKWNWHSILHHWCSTCMHKVLIRQWIYNCSVHTLDSNSNKRMHWVFCVVCSQLMESKIANKPKLFMYTVEHFGSCNGLLMSAFLCGFQANSYWLSYVLVFLFFLNVQNHSLSIQLKYIYNSALLHIQHWFFLC